MDKAGKSLHEWRNIAAKSKKQSFTCARENERLQDLARLQSISQSQQSNNKSSSHHHHHMTEKEASKLEARRRKAEDSSRRADTEFYTVSVRAERARLEYESTVRKGVKQLELLEEERSSALKDLANVYLAHLQALAPRLQQVTFYRSPNDSDTSSMRRFSDFASRISHLAFSRARIAWQRLRVTATYLMTSRL